MTIERINVDGDYEPDNCEWITKSAQAHNRSTSKKLTYNGKTQDVSLWAKEYGINYSTLQGRLYRGMSLEQAITIPKRGKKHELTK